MNLPSLAMGVAALGLAVSASAFTDSNAEMQVLAQDQALARPARTQVVQALWVPPSAKSLDGFKPPVPRPSVAIAAPAPVASKPGVTGMPPHRPVWRARLR
jgi:hypothetical protein